MSYHKEFHEANKNRIENKLKFWAALKAVPGMSAYMNQYATIQSAWTTFLLATKFQRDIMQKEIDRKEEVIRNLQEKNRELVERWPDRLDSWAYARSLEDQLSKRESELTMMRERYGIGIVAPAPEHVDGQFLRKDSDLREAKAEVDRKEKIIRRLQLRLGDTMLRGSTAAKQVESTEISTLKEKINLLNDKRLILDKALRHVKDRLNGWIERARDLQNKNNHLREKVVTLEARLDSVYRVMAGM